jgi:hypothetical protein
MSSTKPAQLALAVTIFRLQAGMGSSKGLKGHVAAPFAVFYLFQVDCDKYKK